MSCAHMLYVEYFKTIWKTMYCLDMVWILDIVNGFVDCVLRGLFCPKTSCLRARAILGGGNLGNEVTAVGFSTLLVELSNPCSKPLF